MEFIINNTIKIHPMALVRLDSIEDRETCRQIEQLTRGYAEKASYFVEHLARGIAKIAAAHYPEPVIVRMSDFKTNEYADLIGGRPFEPREENPMLGFRGAARYYSDQYRDGFALECRALKMVREEIGLDNVIVMIPFCRTPEEADRVLAVMARHGLKQGKNDLQVYVMCEVPSNVVLAEEFAERFDGFSIGSNDLTQLVLGVDRGSSQLAPLFDERHLAVKKMIHHLIEAAHKAGRKVGICGEAPSNYPDFAGFLVEAGIDSISLNPDSLVRVKQHVARVEKKARQDLQHGAALMEWTYPFITALIWAMIVSGGTITQRGRVLHTDDNSTKIHPRYALGYLVAQVIPSRHPILNEGPRHCLGPVAGYFVGSIKCS